MQNTENFNIKFYTVFYIQTNLFIREVDCKIRRKWKKDGKWGLPDFNHVLVIVCVRGLN